MTNVATDLYGVLAESGVTTVPALRGQKVGVAIGTGSEQFGIQLLERSGMTLKDVQVVNVEPPEMVAALQRGNVVAIFAFEPWITRGKMALGERVRTLPGTDFYTVQNHLVMMRDWFERNRETALRLLRAVKEAGEFARERSEEATRMVSKFLKVDLELVKALMPKNSFRLVLDDTAMEYMKKQTDALIATKRLQGPFDYKGYVYPDLLREIDPKAVSYTTLQ